MASGPKSLLQDGSMIHRDVGIINKITALVHLARK
jgi:hypothetical protein